MKRYDRMTMNSVARIAGRLGALVVTSFFMALAIAQAPSPPAATQAGGKAPDADALAPLGWLEGCWRGTVNKREYREHWMPLRGNLLVGVSHTVSEGKTQDYEYLRLEARPDGVYYVATPSGKKETAFRLAEQTFDRTADRNDAIFVFVNTAQEFPEKITYRRASEGWLYAAVEGKIGGADRQVTYPMRRIGCESGELIPK